MSTELSDRIARYKAEAAERLAAAPECPEHPDHKVGYCDPCREAAEAKREADEYTRHIAGQNRVCDQRFPVRYRCASATHPQVQAWIDNYLAAPRRARGLLILGATGTGKTHQAYGALRAIVAASSRFNRDRNQWEDLSWKATTYADLTAEMRPSAGNDPEEVLQRNRSAGILLLDDLAAARSTEWVEEHLYRLINGRYEHMRASIFTTNLDAAALRDAVGDRIASRLVESCERVVMEGPDLRRTGVDRPATCPVHAEGCPDYAPPSDRTNEAEHFRPTQRPFWEN